MRVSEWTTPSAGSYLNLFPSLATSRAGNVRGLLGNANAKIGDDYEARGGGAVTPAELYTTYADSWRISALESPFDYEPGESTSTYNGTPADPDYTVADLDPAAVAAATAACNAAGIFDEPWLSACILDVVVFDDTGAAGATADAADQMPDGGV